MPHLSGRKVQLETLLCSLNIQGELVFILSGGERTHGCQKILSASGEQQFYKCNLEILPTLGTHLILSQT